MLFAGHLCFNVSIFLSVVLFSINLVYLAQRFKNHILEEQI